MAGERAGSRWRGKGGKGEGGRAGGLRTGSCWDCWIMRSMLESRLSVPNMAATGRPLGTRPPGLGPGRSLGGLK